MPPIVLIATSIRPSLATSAAAAPRPFRLRPFAAITPLASPNVVAPPTGARTRTASASAERFVTGIAPAVSSRSGVPELAKSTHVVPQPAKPVPRAGSKRGRTLANVPVAVWTYAAEGSLRELVTKSPRRPPDGDVGRDAHPGIRVGDARGRRTLLEAEAEPGRIGARAAGPRDVDVELVRILVVRDVDVRATVAVHVDERGAEPVAEVRRLEPGLVADLLEAPCALVQIEQVADAGHVRREAGEGVLHRVVQVGVAGDEDVRPPVAVHVRDGGAGVPAVLRELRLGEGAVARVPEQVDAARRRHDQVGVAVTVEIRRNAAVALDRQVGMRGGADVLEVAVDVLEQRGAGETAVLLPLLRCRRSSRS